MASQRQETAAGIQSWNKQSKSKSKSKKARNEIVYRRLSIRYSVEDNTLVLYQSLHHMHPSLLYQLHVFNVNV